MTTEQSQIEQDFASMEETKFLKKYNKEAIIELAGEMEIEVDEDESKSSIYAELVEATTGRGDGTPDPENEMTADEQLAAATADTKPINPLRGFSEHEEPVNSTWFYADQLAKQARDAGQPAPRRKDVVNYCIAQGITYYTARTQYQAWFKHTNKGTRLIADGNPIPKKQKKAVAPAT